ncbi:MAG TPA: 50S ribosomal protein L11 methyltransferase [Vicinamibacterales bacterium]
MSLVLDEHRQYLADRSRIERYESALRETIRPGDVVVDLASGTGILGLLACRAGAARVYAVEVQPIAGVARAIARANGYADRLHVLHCHSSEARLPEPADVVLSDQIGRFGFDAGLLPLFDDARARLLKPGGRLIPSRLDLIVAPVEHPRQFDRVAFWGRRPAGFDFATVRPMAANTGYPTRLGPRQLLSEPQPGVRLDLAVAAHYPLRLDAAFVVRRNGTLDGIAGWFSAQLSPSATLSNSPLDPHRITRRQAFFPIESPVAVGEGDRVDVAMRILPEERIVSWTVTVHADGGPPVRFSHSTLKGMIIDGADLRMTDPAYRPALTDRGVARRCVLELCDGVRTLAQIETEVFARHPGLFGSAAEAAVFVGEVVTRYTQHAT